VLYVRVAVPRQRNQRREWRAAPLSVTPVIITTEGPQYTCVEDCPVCCRANTILVDIDEDGNGQVWADPEQDYE